MFRLCWCNCNWEVPVKSHNCPELKNVTKGTIVDTTSRSTSKTKTISPKTKEDLTKKWRRPHNKQRWLHPETKTTSQKNEDNLTKKWRRLHQKTKMTSQKNENDLPQKRKRPYMNNHWLTRLVISFILWFSSFLFCFLPFQYCHT